MRGVDETWRALQTQSTKGKYIVYPEDEEILSPDSSEEDFYCPDRNLHARLGKSKHSYCDPPFVPVCQQHYLPPPYNHVNGLSPTPGPIPPHIAHCASPSAGMYYPYEISPPQQTRQPKKVKKQHKHHVNPHNLPLSPVMHPQYFPFPPNLQPVVWGVPQWADPPPPQTAPTLKPSTTKCSSAHQREREEHHIEKQYRLLQRPTSHIQLDGTTRDCKSTTRSSQQGPMHCHSNKPHSKRERKHSVGCVTTSSSTNSRNHPTPPPARTSPPPHTKRTLSPSLSSRPPWGSNTSFLPKRRNSLPISLKQESRRSPTNRNGQRPVTPPIASGGDTGFRRSSSSHAPKHEKHTSSQSPQGDHSPRTSPTTRSHGYRNLFRDYPQETVVGSRPTRQRRHSTGTTSRASPRTMPVQNTLPTTLESYDCINDIKSLHDRLKTAVLQIQNPQELEGTAVLDKITTFPYNLNDTSPRCSVVNSGHPLPPSTAAATHQYTNTTPLHNQFGGVCPQTTKQVTTGTQTSLMEPNDIRSSPLLDSIDNQLVISLQQTDHRLKELLQNHLGTTEFLHNRRKQSTHIPSKVNVVLHPNAIDNLNTTTLDCIREEQYQLEPQETTVVDDIINCSVDRNNGGKPERMIDYNNPTVQKLFQDYNPDVPLHHSDTDDDGTSYQTSTTQPVPPPTFASHPMSNEEGTTLQHLQPRPQSTHTPKRDSSQTSNVASIATSPPQSSAALAHLTTSEARSRVQAFLARRRNNIASSETGTSPTARDYAQLHNSTKQNTSTAESEGSTNREVTSNSSDRYRALLQRLREKRIAKGETVN